MSSLRAWSRALSCSTCASASRCRRPFSTIPARRSAIADSWSTSDGVNSRCSSVWTLSTPTTWSCHVSGTDSIEATKRRWSIPRTHRKRGSAATSGMTMASRVAATRPVIPSPNGTTARPIWKRSRPLVAASVRRVPSRSSRYSDDTLAPSASRVPSTTVSSSSSHVWAVVTRPSSSWRNRSSAIGSCGRPRSGSRGRSGGSPGVPPAGSSSRPGAGSGRSRAASAAVYGPSIPAITITVPA